MPAVSIPLIAQLESHTCTQGKTQTHTPPNSPILLSVFMGEAICGLIFYFYVSNWDTHREDERIHHLDDCRVRTRRWHTFYSVGSCKLLLNNQGLIDRKRMCCHFPSVTVINTFFILYLLQGIIVLLAAIPS